eukprot:1798952-Pyramimonas_sp.AAC.1
MCGIVCYFPPRPRSRAEHGGYFKTVARLITWLAAVLSVLPARCSPFVYCDLNDGIGEARSDGVWASVNSPVVGIANKEVYVNGAGHQMRTLMETHEL